jgi:hypothetical protein
MSAYVYLPVTPENIALTDASLLYGEGRHRVAGCSRERGKRYAQRLYYDRDGLPYVWGRCRWRKRYVVGVQALEIDGRRLESCYGLVLDGGSFEGME